MNSDAPLRGGYTSTGIWLPTSALEAKADRSVTGVAPQGPGFRNAGVLEGRMNADNRFRDLSSYISAIKRVPWVWACVSVIAYNFANNGYQLLDAEGAEIEDPYDPFLRLWVRPNKRQTGFHFRELFMHYMQLAGESFVTLEEWDGNDQPHEMYLPNPARMRIQQDPSTGDVLRYWYDATGSNFATQQGFRGMVPYEPHEVIHVKYANPLDELRGLGAVEAMEDTLNIVAEMTGTELSYWKSGGRITGVLQTEQQVDDLTFDKLVQRWRDFTTGSGRDRSRFKTAILEQGLKYQPIAEGLRGLDLTKMEDSKRDVVLANFGVPLQKLAIFNAATGYKSDDADRFFYGETMEPIFTRVEDGGAQPLVEIFNPDRIFRFDRRNYEDDTVKLNNAKVMQGLLYTFGEISTYLGVDPPDDVRKDMVLPPAGATPVTLDQLKNLGQDPVQHPLQPPPKPTPTPSKPPGQVPLAGTQPSATNTENGRSGAVDANGHLPNRATTAIKALGLDPDTMDPETVKHLRPAEKQALRAHYDAELAKAHAVARTHRRPTEAKGLARLNYVTKAAHRAIGGASPRRGTAALGAGEHIRRAIAAIRTRLTPKHAARIKDAFDTQRRRLTSVLKDAPEAFRRLQTAEQRQAWLRDRWPSEPLAEAITGLHVEAANDGWRMAKRSLGFTLGKDAPGFETKEGPTGTEQWVSPTLEGRYGKLPEDRITGVDDTTIARVEEMVSEGVRRGYSALQIANGNPDENYDGVTTLFEDDYRAEEIARTEAMFAANWGSTTSLLDSGVQQVEGMDGHDDPECAERDGKLFDLDPDTGHAVDDDGEPVVDHPNGTLAFAPRIDTSVVPTGALDGDGAAGEVTASEEEAEAEWEVKVGTGQNNNPQGVNQTSHRGGGRRKGPTKHTHANGVTHTHAGGHVQHAHSAGAHASGAKPTASQAIWDANVAAKREAPEGEQKHGTGQTNNADGANQTGSHPDAKKREHRHANGVVHSHVGGARPHTHDKSAEEFEDAKAISEIDGKALDPLKHVELHRLLNEVRDSSTLTELRSLGWDVKTEFFVAPGGCVVPIRDSPGYDDAEAQAGGCGGSSSTGPIPQVSDARRAALIRQIIAPTKYGTGPMAFVNAYRTARLAGMTHADVLNEINRQRMAAGYASMHNDTIERAIGHQFTAAGLPTEFGTQVGRVAGAVGTGVPAGGTPVATTGTPNPAGGVTATEPRGTGPGGRVTEADRILAAHPNGGVNDQVKALYGRDLARFQAAGGTTIHLSGGDPRAPALLARFAEVQREVQAQNTSSRVSTGLSFHQSNLRELTVRGSDFRAVVALDASGRPVASVGYTVYPTEYHVGVAGSAGVLPGAGMAMQHGLATVVANAGTRLGSSYLPDAKPAHASWGRTISPHGYSSWTLADARTVASFKAAK